MILSYLPLFKLRLTESQLVLSFHCMSFSRLYVSPEVTVIVEVSPKLLFNVTFPNLCRKGRTDEMMNRLSNIIDRERRRKDLDILLYFKKKKKKQRPESISTILPR